MSQYYNYRTGALIVLMSMIAFISLVMGLYFNESIMGNTPQAVRYIILGLFEIMLLLPLFLYVIGNGKSIKHAFRLKPISFRALRDILLVAVGMFIVLEVLQFFLDALWGSEVMTSQDMKVSYPLNYLIIVLVVGIITPVVEESLFRGYLLRIMLRSKYTPLTAIILQAVLFSVIHLSLRNAPTILIAGIILGFIAYSFYSIIPGIIIHSIFNILVLININVPKISEKILYGPAYIPWLIALVGLLLLIAGLVNIKRNVRVQRTRRDGKE
ncbi:MAG: CPBP family intramembrane metalloprotease [Candidatus Marinimicrobia bacterium]|nr:CPBP family intramembrane metalloprotease [Candidatus Neomarinimicrobiota bacterium]